MTTRVLVLAVGIVAALAAPAAAYPHFQLSSGSARCSQCHIGPAGGGLLTPWGQDEFGDTIAPGGDGSFLHELITLPESLQLGGNIRLAALANDTGASDGAELAAFPMQVDLAMRVASGAWSVVGVVGGRGRVRSGASDDPDNPASKVSASSAADRIVSREHYVLWQPEETGAYARLGRFAAPYGLRLADHTTYVRRYLGTNLLEETYGLGGGWLGETWEAHATAFVYDPLQGGPRKEVGGAAMLEVQATDALILGASTRASVASADTRLQAGVHGKLWLDGAKLLWQAEAHGVRQLFEGDGDRWQLAAYTGPVLVPTRGLYTGVAYQVFAEDLAVRSVTRHAADAWVSYFPYAHIELMAMGRAQRIGPQEHAYLGLLQLHYAL